VSEEVYKVIDIPEEREVPEQKEAIAVGYIDSNSIDINHDGLCTYYIKNNEYYFPLEVFNVYLTTEDDRHIIAIPDKPELVLYKETMVRDGYSLDQNSVRISALGMTLEKRDGKIWLEYI
jgi:hypothetical protein